MSFQDISEIACIYQLPVFYQQVLLGFCKSKNTKMITSKNILYNQMLWGNRNLKIDGKCLYSKFMIDVNLLFFKDVVLHNGKINADVYNSLQNKIHYFKDITMINKLVRRHKNIICENININNPEENTIHVYKKVNNIILILKYKNSFNQSLLIFGQTNLKALALKSFIIIK